MPLIRKTPDSTTAPAASAANALRDGPADARWSAARGLTTSADVGALGTALDVEKDPRGREAILPSLARIGDAASARAVIPHIRSEDASVRTAALDSLRAMPRAVADSLPG